MKNYRFVGKTSKEAFLIKGINVFNERWIHEGSCDKSSERQKLCIFKVHKRRS